MDALRYLHASKYKRPRNKPNDGCLRKPAKRNGVRTSKQLRLVATTEAFNGNQALDATLSVLYDQISQTVFNYPPSAITNSPPHH